MLLLNRMVILLPALLIAACAGGEADKALVRGYLQTLVIGQEWQRWDEYFAPGARINDSPRAQEILSSMSRGMRSAFPDLTVEVLEQVAENGTVASHVRFSGTHVGAFDATPPTGEAVSFDAMLMDRIEAGRVVESWHQVDVMGLSRRVRGIAAGKGRSD